MKLQNWFYKYNAWSFTKHRLWEQCRRAYYYNYIGAALPDSPGLVSKIKYLKSLDSRSVLQGKLVHDVLEEQLKHHSRGQPMAEDTARSQFLKGVESYRKNASKQIVEFFNGAPINEAFFDYMREDGLDQLSLFFGVIWPQIVHLQYLRHEKFDHFQVDDVKAIVKVDYAVKNQDGKVVILDWKTGADKAEYESDLQVGAYVLWATKYYKLFPDQVESHLVYLATGMMRSHTFSEEQLGTIEELIVSDFSKMNETYDIESFSPDPSRTKCIGCHFASICSDSMADELKGS